jgi:hypothetical protein
VRRRTLGVEFAFHSRFNFLPTASSAQLLLGGNRIKDKGMCAFADMLEINDTLKCLDLSANEIGDAGVEYFALRFRESGGLTRMFRFFNICYVH